MVIGDISFTDWVHTSQTIRSKCSWHALYLGGALSESPHVLYDEGHELASLKFRCTARPNNLDNDPMAILRSSHHTNALKDAFENETGILWGGYGIVDYVTVSSSQSLSCGFLCLHDQPFTTHFPRADIYELLSPDLLHQVIKGTFKDHLVEWVGKYLEGVHGKTRAKELLADIDQRYAAMPLLSSQTLLLQKPRQYCCSTLVSRPATLP